MRAEIVEGSEAIAALSAPWRALEGRALEPNAYLSPRFVLPALDHLSSPGPPWAVAVWSSAACAELLGLGVFQRQRAQRRFPLPHAQAWGSVHAYLGGLLLDAGQAEPVLCALLDAVASRSPGLHLRDLPWHGPTAQLLCKVARQRRLSWHGGCRYERACLDLGPEGAAARWQAHVTGARRREAARLRRRLQERGRLDWQWLRAGGVDEAAVDRFLALEHAGWKGREGTSLRSDAPQEAFFCRMAEAFRRDGELFFTELRLDGRTIASSCNLRTGDRGFAFKVAFDPAHARCGPGILNELGFLAALEADCDGLRHLDSGAQPGGFIEHYWPDRVVLATGTLALHPVAEAVASVASAWSRLRRHWRPAAAREVAIA
jgi:CelD/BcsL family acetyltransferase involved in cellulose biosynthesis